LAEILQSFADILWSLNPVVPQLEISRTSGEGEEPDWKRRSNEAKWRRR
jgi:hypothetical protein